MSVINTQPLIGASGQGGVYNIDRSLRLRSSASASLTRTPASTGNLQKWTWSGWVKRGSISTLGQAFTWYNSGFSYIGALRFETNDTLNIYEFNIGSSAYIWNVQTTQVFRDPSAWYHIVIAYDSTQATAANRVIIYVNGVAVSSYSATNYPSLNYQSSLNRSGYPNYIGAGYNGTTLAQYFDGYLADTYLIDGQQLTPSSFGETNSATGVWRPKKYSGTYGTNGFYLNFKDNSAATATTIGKDSSGNGNNWTPNNISVTAGVTYDSMTDVPTLTSATAANYCVLNPLSFVNGSAPTDGNLKCSNAGSGVETVLNGTLGVSSGKFYWEAKATGTLTNLQIGIQSALVQTSSSTSTIRGYADSGVKRSGNTYTSYGNSFTNNDIISIALDLDNGKIWFGKNGVWQASGDPVAGTNAAFTDVSGTVTPWMTTYNTGAGTSNWEYTFGQRPFTYTPPTGYVALNTFNLPDSTIKAGNKVMDATTYTGNGSTQSITNSGSFKPDLVWMKGRNYVVNNVLNDSVRGISKFLFSDATSAEANNTGYGVTSFNSNGFTATDDSAGNYGSNGASKTYVGWQWQAGQGVTSSNTSGTITSTVSVNASAGFSIVSFNTTSASGTSTIGHGLGVAPSMIIMKDRSTAYNWDFWSSGLGSIGNTLILNSTAAVFTTRQPFTTTAPTSSVFSFNNAFYAVPSDNVIAYCWSEVAGFSKFGSYTGNGSTDGPFVYLGFRPKYILIKNSSVSQGWNVHDTSVSPYNVASATNSPSNTGAEITSYANIDILSNGFKLKDTDAFVNGSGNLMIYAAFAENPFKNSLAR